MRHDELTESQCVELMRRAAPDLYAELRLLVLDIEGMFDSPDSSLSLDISREQMADWLRGPKAAIAKAEGAQ